MKRVWLMMCEPSACMIDDLHRHDAELGRVRDYGDAHDEPDVVRVGRRLRGSPEGLRYEEQKRLEPLKQFPDPCSAGL